MNQTIESKKKRRPFRKHLILPAEHGTWFWFFVPFFVGVGVMGVWNTAVTLTFIGGFAAFLMRQPLTAWLQIQRGRGRKADGRLALGWFGGLGLIAVGALVALLAMGYTDLLWLLLPLLPLIGLYLYVARQRRAAIRALWLEMAGGVGLAVVAPAVTIAAAGQVGDRTWALWGLMAAQNVLGAHYVYLRLADTHKRPIRRRLVLGSHVVGFAAVLLAGLGGVVPVGTAVPFLGFVLRAGWAVAALRPVENVKRFGLLEVAVEVVSGLWIVGSYWV